MGHFVISVLSLFQIKSDLMNMSQSVEIFMLVHSHLISSIDHNLIFIFEIFDFFLQFQVIFHKFIMLSLSFSYSYLELLFDFSIGNLGFFWSLFLSKIFLIIRFFLLLSIVIGLFIFIFIIIIFFFAFQFCLFSLFFLTSNILLLLNFVSF